MSIPETGAKHKPEFVSVVSLHKAGSGVLINLWPVLELIHVHRYTSICVVRVRGGEVTSGVCVTFLAEVTMLAQVS